MYSFNTENEQKRIITCNDIELQNQIAEEIIKRNSYVVLAYSVKARYAFYQSDFSNVIKNKRIIFDIASFQYDEYEEYCYMLINGIDVYSRAGDEESVKVCKDELLNITNRLSSIESRISELGRQIDDQPILNLPVEVQSYTQQMEVI